MMVTMCVVVILTPLYFRLLNNEKEHFRNSMVSYTEAKLAEFKSAQESILYTARNFYNDSTTQNFFYLDTSDSDRFYQATLVQKKLQLYFQNIDSVENLYLFFPKFGYVVTDNYIFDNFDDFQHYIEISDNKIELMKVNQSNSKFTWIETSFEVTDKVLKVSNKYLADIYYFPMFGDANRQMTLCVLQNPELISDNLLFPESKADSLGILTEEGEIISYTEKVGDSSIQDAILSASKEIEIAGTKYVLFDISDGIYSFKTGISQKYINTSTTMIRLLILTNIVIALLSGILVSSYFAYLRTKPIEKLMNIIRNGHVNSENNDAFQEIEKSLVDMMDEVGRCKLTINYLDNILQKSLLDNAFFGEKDKNNAEDLRKYYKNLPESYIVIALTQENKPVEADILKILKWQITDKVILEDTDASFSYLLVDSTDIGSSRLGKLLQGIKNERKVTIKAGMSNSSCDYSLVSTMSGIARRRLRAGMSQKGVFVFTHSVDAVTTYGGVTVEDLNILQKSLQSGNRESADEKIMTIFKRKEIEHWSVGEYRQVYFSLRTVYLNAIYYLQTTAEQNSIEIIDIPHFPNELEDYNAETITFFFLTMNEALKKQYSLNEAKKEQSLSCMIIEYIDKNYSNPNICAAFISDQFNISEKYVFSLVKNGCGTTLNKYLAELRLNAAVVLLETTTQSTNEIAERVGFSSSNSMYKTMMRLRGVAPSAYRKCSRKE